MCMSHSGRVRSIGREVDVGGRARELLAASWGGQGSPAEVESRSKSGSSIHSGWWSWNGTSTNRRR
jgi:hypothetical protein